MEFTSFIYLIFLTTVFCFYWAVRKRNVQNVILLIVSYFFYGYVHPWFCFLIAVSTLLDYCCGLGMSRFPSYRKDFLILSLLGNLGLLATFKYSNFFLSNLQALGLGAHWKSFEILLPVGISFYTFQTLSYTIDVYRGEILPRKNFCDFALFVSFFPQLVAGPIERAGRLLTQLEVPRRWNTPLFLSAFPLFLTGYFKKLVVADNVAVWVDRIFMLQHPSLFLLFVGALGFAIQIYADFSAYTDIARGSAKLFGIELMENFKSPYLAISPSDFWRRWHISFSSWIRDYLYIPLGGSRVSSSTQFALILFVTMGLSGLWHGAAWHFVAWGIYHAVLLYCYHMMGWGGKWKPQGQLQTLFAWAVFQVLTIFGWALFRCPSLSWLLETLCSPASGLEGSELLANSFLVLFFFAYCSLWIVHHMLKRWCPHSLYLKTGWQWAALFAIFLLSNHLPQQFIYFQF